MIAASVYSVRMTTTRTLSLLSLSAVVALVACSPAPSTTGDQPMPAQDGENFNLTFTELMRLGKNYTCTFADTDEEGNRNSGTVYVESAGKNFSGTFTMQQKDGTVQDGNVISADGWTYIWSDDQAQGVKMQVEEKDSIFGDASDDQTGGMSDDQPQEFECSPWTVDRSMFTPPADKEFVDFGVMMQGMMQMNGADAAVNAGAGANVKATQCAACDHAPDASTKAQCRKALGC